ncbi:hypothetical protein [Helicobacter sp.]|uniref:hypothetical protein n=1 Tax=Helicobacter sp. TaxID=218 RepID=UPI00199A06E9|nr:hypothetical protein [Helicobacter sp.]MBD5164951.1 hypothetical protein [Helicobacter sp.]
MKTLNNGGGGRMPLYAMVRNLIIQKSLELHNGLKNKLLNAIVKQTNFLSNQEKF